MLGWNKLVDDINAIYQLNKDSTIIFCQNYGEAGAVNIIGRKYYLPEVISYHDIFYYWKKIKTKIIIIIKIY